MQQLVQSRTVQQCGAVQGISVEPKLGFSQARLNALGSGLDHTIRRTGTNSGRLWVGYDLVLFEFFNDAILGI